MTRVGGGGQYISATVWHLPLLLRGMVLRRTLLSEQEEYPTILATPNSTLGMITSFKLNIYPLQKTRTRACTTLAEIVSYFLVVEKRTFHPFLQSPTSPFSRQREKPGMTLRGRAEF